MIAENLEVLKVYMHNNIWILVDFRTGASTQAIALAENISKNYKIKNIEYNFLASLPNYVLGATDIHVKNSSALMNLDDPPRLIISAGRRCASFSLALKNHYPDVKIIQIMRPFLDSSKFDLIVLPQHDKYDGDGNNMMRVIGSLHNAEDKIALYKEDVRSNGGRIFNCNRQKFIAVIIGGDTKNYKFEHEEMSVLAKQISDISSNHGMNIYITFSRRTSKKIKDIFYKEFPWPHIIYDPVTSNNRENPYYAMLAEADFIILTSDSISMCSEASASGKPLYIFCPNSNKMKKHRYFVQQLLDLDIARLLSSDLTTLQYYEYSSFNEAKKVGSFIKENIL